MVIPFFFLAIFLAGIAYLSISGRIRRRRARREYERRVAETGDKFVTVRGYDPSDEPNFFIDTTPAPPLDFGYKTSWIAVRGEDSAAVAEVANPEGKPTYRTNMQHGIRAALRRGYTYVLPPIEGWVLVLSRYFSDPQISVVSDRLDRIGAAFPEVCYFASHRGVGAGYFARYRNGRLERRLTVADNEVYHNVGELSVVETEIVEAELAKLAAERDTEMIEWLSRDRYARVFGDEDHILRLAAAWSIDPSKLVQYAVTDLGILINE